MNKVIDPPVTEPRAVFQSCLSGNFLRTAVMPDQSLNLVPLCRRDRHGWTDLSDWSAYTKAHELAAIRAIDVLNYARSDSLDLSAS